MRTNNPTARERFGCIFLFLVVAVVIIYSLVGSLGDTHGVGKHDAPEPADASVSD